MMFLLFYYLVFNVIAGIVLAISYYIQEDSIVDGKEFAWLLLFPTVGLGKWKYNQQLRRDGTTEFPEAWYVWKHMKSINWVMIILCALSLFIAVGAFSDNVGSGTEWASQQNNPAALMFGLVADGGMFILSALFFFIAAFVLAIMFLVFILVPHLVVKNIESNVYRQKYLEEMNRRKRGGTS